MGREIRRVPVNWEHPKNEYGNYQPLFDRDYESAKKEWLDNLAAWQNGTHKDFEASPELQNKYDYWEWNGNPPDRETCRPKWETDPVGFQVYETVSEGTPVSPVFETTVELKNWLMTQGYSEKASEQFIKDEWAISMVYTPATGLKDGISALDDI